MSLHESSVLLRDRHIKYWLRCAKTFLPQPYTSNDSNRMTLAFFIVSALDLLDVLDSKIEPEERSSWIAWIYGCQLDSGGFRGFTGTKLSDDLRTPENQHWDPANVPATFFALVTLVVLGDDLSRVKRWECLAWLPKVQRPDGSFGETLGENESIEGGSDLRFCCCAAGIRHVLRGPGGLDVQDFDVDCLIAYIVSSQVGAEATRPSPYPANPGAVVRRWFLRRSRARIALYVVPNPLGRAVHLHLLQLDSHTAPLARLHFCTAPKTARWIPYRSRESH